MMNERAFLKLFLASYFSDKLSPTEDVHWQGNHVTAFLVNGLSNA